MCGGGGVVWIPRARVSWRFTGLLPLPLLFPRFVLSPAFRENPKAPLVLPGVSKSHSKARLHLCAIGQYKPRQILPLHLLSISPLFRVPFRGFSGGVFRVFHLLYKIL